MPIITGFFWPNQFLDKAFLEKEFRSVERGAGYRTEVNLYGIQFAQALRPCHRHQPSRPPLAKITLMSATRYATMSLRHAKTLDHYDYLDRNIVYPNLGIY
jgi:hypothetical protein